MKLLIFKKWLRTPLSKFLVSPEFIRYCQWKNIELSIGGGADTNRTKL